ncbi:nitrate reductase [Billgrantia saliphila]|uniref:nitrate reductase n=1 Tax=Billgrantia saliphila TaxID=1848458 RepID=UPI000CE54C57|nr:nitrate reductase [Halomonas saliphila]
MREARTTCPYCGVGCGVLACVEGERIADVQGDPAHPANFGRLCVKGSALHETLGHHGRLTRPRVDGVEVDWDTALAAVAERLTAVQAARGSQALAAYLSGQLLTEDYYVANKLFKGFLGTSHLDTNSRLCMASAVAAHKRAFGADAVPCCYEDLEEAELVVLVGSNLAWNHPVLFQRLKVAKQRNPLMRVVVIDPRVTDTCEIADLYLGLAPGSDARLFTGLLAWMAERNKLDRVYLEAHTQGFDEALAAANEQDASVEAIAADCDVDSERLETFFYWFASHLHVVTLFSQGVNQSTSGTDKGNAIINCHLAGGKIGLPGAGPFSITGQPNAMGGREVGGLANQLAAHMDYDTPGARDRVTRFWTTERRVPSLPDGPGHKAVDLFAAIERGEVQALWIMATNPAVSLPRADRVRAALAKCPLVIVSECMADADLLDYADIVLPASSWSEKDGTVTNSERRISRQRGILPPPGEARHDWWIMCEVAKRLGFGEAFDYAHPSEIFDEHARLSGFENDEGPGRSRRLFDISGLAGLDRTAYDALAPIQWPVNADAPHGTARLFIDGRFATPDGRARLLPVRPRPPAQKLDAARPLRLNTGRIRDQWHTMTRTGRAPRLMNHRAEPFIEIAPEDAAALGVKEHALARLHGAGGDYIGRVRVSRGQRRGEVFVPMHWSGHFSGAARMGELIEAHVDPVSGQPESKHGAVALEPLAVGWEATLLVADELGASEAAWCDASRYWARIPLGGCQRWQLAGGEPGSACGDVESAGGGVGSACGGVEKTSHDWLAWLEARLPVAPTLWCTDPSSGRLRAAGVDDAGRLRWWLMAGPPMELPNLAWLDARFAEATAGRALTTSHRRRLLAGCDDGAANQGPVVCSCHQVGQRAILGAIREGDDSVEALGARLACGTQCGSCIPELKSLIEEEKAHASAEPTEDTVVA